MTRRRIRLFLLSFLTLWLLLSGTATAAGPVSGETQAGIPSDKALQQAWERARDSGSYRFLSTSEQTLYPRPLPQTIGQRDVRITLEYDGAVLLPDRAYVEMRVAGANQQRSVTLLRDGSQSFMLQDGQLQPAQDALGLAAVTNDVLGYLSAAENATLLSPPDGHPELARYGFALSGKRFEAYARAQAQIALEAEPGAPDGIRLQPIASLQSISGRGELWVNADGLPVRQVLDLEMPEASEYYGARVHMTVDVSGYGEVSALPQAAQNADGSWRLEGGAPPMGRQRTRADTAGDKAQVAVSVPQTKAESSLGEAVSPPVTDAEHAYPLTVAPSTVVLFLLALFTIVVWRFLRGGSQRRNPQRGYALLAIVLVPVLVFSPVLQSGQVVRFMERTIGAAEARSAGTADLLRTLGFEPAPREAGALAGARADAPVAGDSVPVSLNLTARDALTREKKVPGFRSMLAGGSSAALLRCGDGEVGVDTDGDGLSDVAELCLGTSPYNADSDSDAISDRVELDGFDLGGKHWDSDPLNPDSNGDKLLDTFEWPSALTPNGQAASADIDGDGVPNLWDDDDDGDGVPDWLDVSPQARSGFTSSLDLSANSDALAGYTYIELQVQPQDLKHLRYSTTALDWPMDDEGNVQDLDTSRNDLRMSPFLLIETNVPTDAALEAKYGFATWTTDTGYLVLVPLVPLEDGGMVYALSGKVAYAPGQVLNMQWRAKMVWMTQMQQDAWSVHYDGGSTGVGLDTQTRLLHQYQETFRLIGLHMTLNEGYEAAVLGTPGERDDLELFRVMLGLGNTFQTNLTLEGQAPGETALQEIGQRFSIGSTASITHTFGVQPYKVGVSGPTQYLHADAGMAYVGSQLVPDFLRTYQMFYGNARCQDADGSPVNCATLLVAYEQSQGGYDLSQMPTSGAGLADLSRLYVNVTDVPVVTTRGVQMRMYEEGAGGWQMVTAARALELVEQRYKGVYQTTLSDLYPDVTADQVRLVTYSAYLAALSPSYRPVAIDGRAMVPVVADESALALNRAISAELAGEVDNAIDYVALGTGVFSALMGSGSTFIWVLGDFSSMLDDWAKSSGLANSWNLFGVGIFAAATAASVVMGAINAICKADDDVSFCRNEEALYFANIGVSVLGILAQAQTVASVVIQYVQGALKAISTAALVAQGIGMVVGIGISWVVFGFAVATSGGDPVTWRVALAEAIVTTVYLIVLFALNFIPIIGQIITAILSLIDMIIGFFTGLFGGETWSIAKAILNIFYDASTSTVLAAAAFGSFHTALTDADAGLVSGNTFKIGIPFTGVITKTSDGTNSDLEKSYVQGSLVPNILTSDFAAQADTSVPRDCDIISGELHCSNTAALRYGLTPHINGIVGFTSLILYRTVWAEYGMYHAWRWATHTEDGQIPEAEDVEWASLPLDVIPNDLDDLWAWNALINRDRDGDGLENAMEAAMGTNPDQPDTDGDGLSDYYEWLNYATYGCDPLLPDTDSDGLNDAQERRFGTKPNVADSDGDGLADGEEVRHLKGGVVIGGWTVNLPGYGEARVMSSPMRADDDGDNLSGYEEKAHGLSPRAANALVPTLSMGVEPVRGLPGGRSGVYLRTGDVVTITLQVGNPTAEPVESTMRLYLPYWFEDIQGGTLAGDRTPTMSRSGSHLSWAFTGANRLQTYEFAATTVTARVASFIMGDVSDITLVLPVGDMTLRRSRQAVVDVLPPEVAILAPANGAFLNDASYVVGGTARDATTWLTGAELSIVPQGQPADLQPLSGSLSPWAHSWSLPADGIYSLQARATDAMGNQRTTATLNVTVDNTPPSATLSSSMVGQVVHLSGAATDNLSGIERVQLAIDGQPWRSVTLTGPGATNASWSYDWSVGVSAQGRHSVRMRALDRAGNASDVSTQEILVDRVAPSSIANSGAESEVPPAVKASTTFTITGVADEGGHLPRPATAADLRLGMDAFADASVWLGISSIRDNDGGVLAAWIGDFDADRLADLAVGLPGPEGNAGQVVVLYGRAGGWPAAPDLEMLQSSRTRFVGEAGRRLGSYVSAAGDVNGDNMFDLLVGERSSTRAFLVFGYPGPLPGVTLDSGQAGLRSLLQAPAAIQGLARAGDVDGDGYDDMIIRTAGAAYLLQGHSGPWPETVDVASEAVATFSAVTGATGVGDVNGDARAEFVTMASGKVRLYRWDPAAMTALLIEEMSTGDAMPRSVALGDVDGDGLDDWLYSDAASRVLAYGGGGTPHIFSGYGGLVAAPGDVDGDGRADILLVDASGVGSLIRQQAGEAPEVFATVSGVGGAANAPYAGGADLNADGSCELVLIPNAAAAGARGFDAPDFSSGFSSPQSLPLGISWVSADGGGAGVQGMLSAGADTRYVDDDGACEGLTPCYTTIQTAVNASDGGGDTVVVYPGAYAAFSVPAGANYDNLIVRGVNPDAVFVEGNPGGGLPDAVTVAADGVRIANLTLRNAAGGVVLVDGAGEPPAAGGSETIVDHVVAHSVQYPVKMTQGSALAINDSTLVGDGVRAVVYVDPAASPSIHAWNNDRTVGSPAVATTPPIAAGGALLNAGGSLYAVPGGKNRQVFASTPGAGGVLGDWSAPFTLKSDYWYDTPGYTNNGYEGKHVLAASGSALYDLRTHSNWPMLGGQAMVTSMTELVHAVAVDPETGDVYLGGEFTQMGGVDAFHIARWDVSEEKWYKVGDPGALLDNGVSGPVYALDFAPAVDDNGYMIAGQYDLYIGGEFDHYHNAAGEPQWAQNIVRWTGSQWEVLGKPGRQMYWNPFDQVWEYGFIYNGVALDFGQTGTAAVYAITHDSTGNVYVGGRFGRAVSGNSWWVRPNIITYYRIASWQMDTYSPWYPMDWGLDGPVHSLYSSGSIWGPLWVGGEFTGHIMRWDYDSFAAMGAGLGQTVVDIAQDPTNGHVYAVADGTDCVQRWDGSAWSAVSGVSWVGDRPYSVLADGEGNIYVGAGSGVGARLKVQRAGTSGLVNVGEEWVGKAMSADWIEDMAFDATGQIYAAVGHWVSYGGSGPYESYGGLSKWVVNGMYRRDVPSGNWVPKPYPPTADGWTAPTAMVGDGSGNLYAVWGSYAAGVLYRYDATANTWTQRALPDAALYLKHLVWANGQLYALGHNSAGAWSLARYDNAANSWMTRAAPPIATGTATGAGMTWSWDGGDGLYLLLGDGTKPVRRYVISANSWDTLPDPTVSFTISQGQGLTRVGSYLYTYGTPGAGVTTNLFRYGALPPSDLRLKIRGTVFVQPDTATSTAWTNLSAATGTYRFRADVDASNAWVGPASATWTPSRPAGTTSFTSAQAAFVAPADGLYRLGAGSLLTAGYHRYLAVAHVYPSQAACAGCGDGTLTWGTTVFATLREAVGTGAARVLVHPGRYPQTFYLVSGVEVMGSGAETTILEAPVGAAATLVTAEGVARATLARVTLAGRAGWQGLLAEGGARGISFTRNIVRDLGTGVRLRGNSAVEVVNNTFVHNGTGLVAEGTNPVNVRNTIFAYNTGVGLQHGASPMSLASTYNDFYANGTAMSPADAGLGTLYHDPRFRSLAENDLRLSAGSLVIDKGSPSDPTPPGTGTRVDMGYVEYNAAGFYVSPRYSETALNDGLTWGVDAFGTIGQALGAAADSVRGWQGAVPDGGYSVGVDAGTYPERVSVPSHVRLVGVGAEFVTVDAGNAGSAVTFDAVTDAAVSGLTLQNASGGGAGVDLKNAASGITISRNVIRSNAGHGVRLASRTSASVDFCTFVNNAGAGVYATGAGTWAEVRNSIVSGGGYGLQAAAGGLIRNDYNLLNSGTNLSGVAAGAHTLTGSPAFAATGHYVLTAGSPALDAADPLAAVPPAGGIRADLGYRELTASPLTLFFGPQIDSIVTGNSGVQSVETGAVRVSDATLPVTATLPTTWQASTPGTAGQPLYFWQRALSQGTPGLYRFYSRASDAAGNTEGDERDWYEGAFVVDNAAPTIGWGAPALPVSTNAAAVLAVAQVSGSITTGTGSRDDVVQVYFRAVGPGGTVNYPADGNRAWIPLPATGNYAIQAIAVDEAGNQAQTGTVTVAAAGTGHVVTITAPSEGSAVASTGVTIRGYVRFAAGGAGSVDVAVSGGATVSATLEQPGARSSAWWAQVALPAGDGAKTVTVRPSQGGTTGSPATLHLTLDVLAPSLVVAGPAAGATVTRTVTFQGTAADAAGSGVTHVDVSLDGGYLWRQASLSSGAWSLDLALAGPLDYVSYPARVRAVDAAGNATVAERVFTLDSMPPTGLAPASFGQPEGQHLAIGTSLAIGWNTPIDAGGPAEVLLAIDQSATTEPSLVVPGTSASATLDVTGDWYAHLAARDAVGNQITYHHGPWHVRDMANPTFSSRRQSIVVDGLIDLDHNEWVAGDLLGTDSQTIETQQLYASWDGLAIYLGWSGAWWTLDGTMWAYLDVAPGGSSQAVDVAISLPFAADVAVRIDSPESGGLYNWTGGAWSLSSEAGAFAFAHGSSGDSEARIVRALSEGQSVALIAFALPPSSGVTGLPAQGLGSGIAALETVQPWAIFPNSNVPGSDPTTAYSWTTPLVDAMGDGQPLVRTVRFAATSPQAAGVAWCPSSNLEYAIRLANPEPTALSGLTITLTATAGLGYEDVAGASLKAGAAGAANWILTVPPIAAGASSLVTVTARLADDLSAVQGVTTTIGLSVEGTTLTGSPVAVLSHQVDGQAPIVSIDAAPGAAIAAGSPTFTGTSGDGSGSGVAAVQVSLDAGTTWQSALGTLAWSARLDIPVGVSQVTLWARAADRCGHVSSVATQDYAVDSTLPLVALAVPAVITTTSSLVTGTTRDPEPEGALVPRVDVQVDSDATGWLAAAGPYAPQGGVQVWAWIWNTPNDDGKTHYLRARAIDQAGNIGFADWQSTVVDVVAPVITVTTQPSWLLLPNDIRTNTGDWQRTVLGKGQKGFYLPVLQVKGSAQATSLVNGVYFGLPISGMVADGSGVRSVRILAYDSQGGSQSVNATLSPGTWTYSFRASEWRPGLYALRVEATDIYGNTRAQGPYMIEIRERGITGMTAKNDGPRLAGQTVTFTATVTSGSNVTYTWDFGDGSTATGWRVQHAYALPGDYAAMVTAANSLSSVQAPSPVYISNRIGVRAGADRSTNEGSALALIATFSDLDEAFGHTATIAWGDGAEDDGLVDEMAGIITGTHRYRDQGTYTVLVTLYAQDGEEAHDTVIVNVANVAPSVTASPATQVVLPGGPMVTIVFTATDVEADDLAGAPFWRPDPGILTAGTPAGLSMAMDPCTVEAGRRQCVWRLAGIADVPEGRYNLRLTITDADGGVADSDVTFTVRPLGAMLGFEASNPRLVPATAPGGASGAFSLGVCVMGTNTSPAGGFAVDQVRIDLIPIGSATVITGTSIPHDRVTCAAFAFSQVPVGVYVVRATLAGGPPLQILEDVLVVFDPYAAAAAGAGWFYWPDTAQQPYPGDRTRFGFIAADAGGGTSATGGLLLLRHRPDGGAYRLESAALSGVALGQDSATPMGWASFEGSGAYLEPGWSQPEAGRAFGVYAEDRNHPGDGTDRFWIEVSAGMGLPQTPDAHAVPLGGGEIVAPHVAAP